jgi:hypothetical protein
LFCFVLSGFIAEDCGKLSVGQLHVCSGPLQSSRNNNNNDVVVVGFVGAVVGDVAVVVVVLFSVLLCELSFVRLVSC